ncbi:unnamed protein product [Pedinophyceae sp. YPF-701]|nr:unnamed protein product [Pedinophyceae sp. YPF-701]
MPRTPERQISLAVRSVCAAFKEGKTRQRTEILLPLIGATDLDDWPGGIQQQFKAALPLVEDLLRGVREGTGLTGKLEAEVIDMGDAVGCFESDKILAVLFPSGSTMKEIIKRAEGKELVLLINPQWSTENAYSNVISDFGILWAKERAEKFLQPFVETFYFVQTRVDGENLRVLRAWPLGYQVFAVDEVGGGRFLGSEPGRPAYATLKELAASFEGSKAAMGIIDRMYAEADYMRKTMKAPPPRE